MSFQIPTAFVEQYNANFQHLWQQKKSRLREVVRVENIVGKNAFFDQLNQTTAYDITSRHADTLTVDTPHVRRRVTTVDRGVADLIDQADLNKILTNPTSAYIEAQIAAMNRKMDDVIIAAAFATAYGGVDGSTTYAFDASNNIVAAASVGLTISKIRSAKQILDSNEVDDNDRFLVIGSKQLNVDLLATTEVTSSDFNTVKALVNGEVNTFLGFKIIRSERLALSSSTRKCIAGHKNSLLVAFGQQPKTSVDLRPDKNNSIQVLTTMTVGATRMDEKGLVEIDCIES